MASLPPALILLAAAALVAVLPRAMRAPVMLAGALAVLAQLYFVLEDGDGATWTWLSFTLTPLRVDALSLVFAWAFSLILLIGTFFSWHAPVRGQQVAALTYAATALGVVFAGDLLTLVIYWELQALASYYLIAAGGMARSQQAGRRYLYVHLVGGALLLGGVLWHYGEAGNLAFGLFSSSSPAGWLVLGAFAINAAIPPLHAWLPDGYPEASVTGTVFLSALTTKTAVYVLLRGFAGWELLVPLGVAMALYGLVYAVLENDMRRLLSYHIISQVGYMVAAVGIGTHDAINGAATHAFAHVIYKGLLMMGVSAVIHATGRRTMTDLGGIVHRMRWVFILYMVGGLSISAFPLFSGFTSKSMIIYAAEHEPGFGWVAYLLYVASVGTFLHTGLKLPYGTWLGARRDDITIGRVPVGMYIGMGIAAVICVVVGVYPAILYHALPFETHYEPYTAAHVVHSLELLAFTALGFWLLLPFLHPDRTISVDTDWFYRKAGPLVRVLVQSPLEAPFTAAARLTRAVAGRVSGAFMRPTATWTPMLRLSAYARARTPEAAVAWLARPPLGVAIAAAFIVFAIVVLLAR
jgi:multicomponent Na+:H+ antiporter subunit D